MPASRLLIPFLSLPVLPLCVPGHDRRILVEHKDLSIVLPYQLLTVPPALQRHQITLQPRSQQDTASQLPRTRPHTSTTSPVLTAFVFIDLPQPAIRSSRPSPTRLPHPRSHQHKHEHETQSQSQHASHHHLVLPLRFHLVEVISTTRLDINP